MTGERPGFAATAEEVATTPEPGECIRIVRRSVSWMPDMDPPYFVTWEYERVPWQSYREPTWRERILRWFQAVPR